MRILAAMVLGFVAAGCGARSYNPEARIDIEAPVEVQIEIVEASRLFGEKNGLKSYFRDKMVREGRRVTQLRMERADGTAFVMDNYMREDTVMVAFYAEESTADWRTVKDAWLREIGTVLAGRGEVREVPVGPPFSLVEEERKRR